MRWLRQQTKVEALSFELQANAGLLVRLRQRLRVRVHNRLRQPGTLAWAFGAGALYGATRSGPARNQGSSNLFHYFNSALALWSLLAKYPSRQL